MTSGTSSPLRTWRAETLTATPRSASSRAAMVAHASRSTQRPSVGDQRRFLGQRHELGGGDVAEQRVPPAQQRLDRHGAVHDDVDHRLEDQAQLAAVERAVEVRAQGGPAVLLDAQGVVVAVHGAGPAARALRSARSPRRSASPVSTSADSAVTPATAVRCRVPPGMASGPTAATRRAATISASAMLPSTRTTNSPSLPRASQSSPRSTRVSRAVSARQDAGLGVGRQDRRRRGRRCRSRRGRTGDRRPRAGPCRVGGRARRGWAAR